MSYNNYMYAIDRDDTYLAHYGVKGMHWGVRKLARDVQRAVNSGNAIRYSKLYQKAQRKLAKYQKQATSGDKYKRRAALLGAGALATGGVAVGGVGGINKAIGLGAKIDSKVANALIKPGFRRNYGQKILDKSGEIQGRLAEWGSKAPFAEKANARADKLLKDEMLRIYSPKNIPKGETALDRTAEWARVENKANRIREAGKMTNNQMLRVGSALASAGLGAAAGYNAYRAATTKRAAQKAEEWQRAINENFGPQRSTRRTKRRSRG